MPVQQVWWGPSSDDSYHRLPSINPLTCSSIWNKSVLWYLPAGAACTVAEPRTPSADSSVSLLWSSQTPAEREWLVSGLADSGNSTSNVTPMASECPYGSQQCDVNMTAEREWLVSGLTDSGNYVTPIIMTINWHKFSLQDRDFIPFFTSRARAAGRVCVFIMASL